jgi:DNA (cytosine-5)-methyltransferase 1
LRQRAFIVASRLGKFKFPDPSHGDPDSLAPGKKKAWITVKDAIADLPADPPKHDTLGGQSGCYVGMPPSAFAKRMRTSKKFPYNHITRSYDKRIIAIIKEMKEGETWDEGSARVRARYERLIRKSLRNSETGRDARDRLIDEGKIIEAFYKRYYWSAYTRLALERPALTITANSNFLGSGRFTHPLKDRGITMREAARLQSFDDAFTFVTSEKRGAETETIGIGLDMIGEAVPPLLAEAIAAEIAVHLDERRN